MAGNKKIPEIRFKGFNREWEEKELGKVAIFSKGRGYTKSDLVDNGTKIILYGRLYTQYQSVITEVDTYVIPKKDSIYSKGNEVIVPASGETAEDISRAATVIESNILLGGDLNIIYPDKKIDSVFLTLNISNGKLQRELSQKAQGKSVVHLHNSDLQEISINYPIINEQSKIGTFFQNLDSLIDLHQRKYDKLTTVKKSMLEKMFPKEGADVPEVRFKGFTEKWEKQNVEELCSISTGKSNTQDRINDGCYPFYVRSPIIERSTRFLYDEEAVLTVGDGVGTGKVYHYVKGKYDLHQRVYRMFNFNSVVGKYFYYYFSEHFNKRVLMMTAKTSVDSVRLEMISDMKISFPNISEQEKIVSIFDNLNNLISLQQQELDKLKNIKKSCLEKMFV